MPDVKIKGYSGNELEYQNVPKVYLAAPESTPDNPVLVPFSFGETLEDVEIIPDFSEGDMHVELPYGYLAKSAIIKEIKKTDPYIEYELNDEGQIINASLYNFTTIPAGCFAYMTALESVDFSKSPGITAIGNRAFQSCGALSNVNIPDTVESIGSHAFYACTGLTSINIPKGVMSLGGYAFYGCNQLENIVIPENVTEISAYVFYNCEKLTSITLPDGITNIGNYAFYNCKVLTNINIPNEVTSIGRNAFCECSSVTTIKIPDGVTTISPYSFSNMESLSNIDMPSGLTDIGNNAFQGCKALISVEIPSGVTSIGRAAFQLCSALQSAIFRTTAGWWYSSNETATTGTSISSGNLANEATAATYIRSTYSNYYWKRS